jgi:hypothetical protein
MLERIAKLRQVSWALGVALAGGLYILTGGKALLNQQLGVLAWKLVLAGSAVGLAHVMRKQLFPYVDLSESLKEKTQAGSLVFLGISILYAAIILAVCSGL